jgi:hypothetical protein
MRKLIVTMFLLVVLGGTTEQAAQAGLVRIFPKHETPQLRKQIIQVNLIHVKYVCKLSTIWEVKRDHCRAKQWLASELRKVTRTLHPALRLPPHYKSWLCIHSYEGSWTDSGDPYWGGLQMDRSFMETFAPRYLLNKGWANSWTPLEQMWVAENAYKESGYSRWPNTAHYCGLI